MFNNDATAGNYTSANRLGTQNGGIGGLTLIAASTLGAWIGGLPDAGNTGMALDGQVLIPNYAATTFHKSFVANWREEHSGLTQDYQTCARWKNTVAVTRLTFAPDSAAFTNGSIFTLYGLN
jgi:hypothetical protein